MHSAFEMIPIDTFEPNPVSRSCRLRAGSPTPTVALPNYHIDHNVHMFCSPGGHSGRHNADAIVGQKVVGEVAGRVSG